MGADPDPGGPTATGFDRTDAGFEALAELVTLARTTLVGEGITEGNLDLVVVDVAEMAELNEVHMGKAGPTDVLAFPMDAPDASGGTDPLAGLVDPDDDLPPLHLGDVILCPEVAGRQAAEHCGSVEAEYALLVIHGVLHVLGHDHAEHDETVRMQARERHHLTAAGFAHPVPVTP
jgi:probable rRNA maturation factor